MNTKGAKARGTIIILLWDNVFHRLNCFPPSSDAEILNQSHLEYGLYSELWFEYGQPSRASMLGSLA